MSGGLTTVDAIIAAIDDGNEVQYLSSNGKWTLSGDARRRDEGDLTKGLAQGRKYRVAPEEGMLITLDEVKQAINDGHIVEWNRHGTNWQPSDSAKNKKWQKVQVGMDIGNKYRIKPSTTFLTLEEIQKAVEEGYEIEGRGSPNINWTRSETSHTKNWPLLKENLRIGFQYRIKPGSKPDETEKVEQKLYTDLLTVGAVLGELAQGTAVQYRAAQGVWIGLANQSYNEIAIIFEHGGFFRIERKLA